MRSLLAVALASVLAVPARAVLKDFAKTRGYPVEKQPGSSIWTLHQEPGLGVFLVHINPGKPRGPYRLTADALAISLHRQRLYTLPGVFIEVQRGDLFDQRAGEVRGGWVASKKGAGIDMIVVTRSETMSAAVPADPSNPVVRKAPQTFAEAKAKLDAMEGDVRRVSLVDGPSLRVDLIRLSGRSALKNAAPSSSILFPVEGSASVTSGEKRGDLRGKRIFLVEPGTSLEITANPKAPLYALLVTRSS